MSFHASSASSAKVLDIGDRAWRVFVDAASDALPFHHPAWACLLAEAYGFRPFALVVSDSKGTIHTGLPAVEVKHPMRPRRWVALPFTDFCPPLASTGQAAPSLAPALDAARHAAGIGRVEVHAELEGPGVFRMASAVTHTLALTAEPETVFRRFHRSRVQGAIKKAEQDGVRVRWAGEKRDLTETFYRIHTETRRRLGVPVQPKRFFSLLWERFIAPGFGFVLLADAGSTAIAGAVFLAWKSTVTYKYGASLREFGRLRANNLLLWEAIRWACEQGYARFDFGKTDLENTGLRAFKEGWGAVEEPLGYSVLADSAPRESKRFPAVERPLGAVLRHSPLWVTRTLGELLYRYSA
jgi:CelD/BcsL family acetyltransferase involved in cellulose biosynthesis